MDKTDKIHKFCSLYICTINIPNSIHGEILPCIDPIKMNHSCSANISVQWILWGLHMVKLVSPFRRWSPSKRRWIPRCCSFGVQLFHRGWPKTMVLLCHGPPTPTFLEVCMVNNLVFRWRPKPLFFMVLGAHGIHSYTPWANFIATLNRRLVTSNGCFSSKWDYPPNLFIQI